MSEWKDSDLGFAYWWASYGSTELILGQRLPENALMARFRETEIICWPSKASCDRRPNSRR